MLPAVAAVHAIASSCTLPTGAGDFEMRVYKHSQGGSDAVALVARVKHGAKRSRADADGAPRVAVLPALTAAAAASPAAAGPRHVLLRVQDQCMTSEIFGSVKCECKAQLDHSMSLIQSAAAARWEAVEAGVGSGGAEDIVGLVIYLLQEGRGIGLAAKVAAYALQEDEGGGYAAEGVLGGGLKGLDTVDANRALALPDDAREYDAVRDILLDLDLGSAGPGGLYVLTNNPRKVEALRALGVVVDGRLPCAVEPPSPLAARYMQAKAERMGHILP